MSGYVTLTSTGLSTSGALGEMFQQHPPTAFFISSEKSELGCSGIFQLMERLSSNQKQLNKSIEHWFYNVGFHYEIIFCSPFYW